MWNGDINNIDEVISYLNDELSKGRTQKDIEINDFKVNERVIAKRLTSRGYKRINNQYIKYDKGNTGVINPSKNKYEGNHTEVIKVNKDKREDGHTIVIKDEYDNNNTLVINQKEVQNKLIGLAQNYDKLLEMIQAYDKKYDAQYDKEYDGITIELPIETKKEFRVTIRVNNVIWEQFTEFANAHKEFRKMDLLSSALKLYMEKYK